MPKENSRTPLIIVSIALKLPTLIENNLCYIYKMKIGLKKRLDFSVHAGVPYISLFMTSEVNVVVLSAD